MSERAVWLSNGWSTVAHSLNGATNDDHWRTRCGETIQSRDRRIGRIVEDGIIIQWANLNHDRIRLCRRCFTPEVPSTKGGES